MPRRFGQQHGHQAGIVRPAATGTVRWNADYDASPDFAQWGGGVQQFAAGYAKILTGAATDHTGPTAGKSGQYAQAKAVAGNLVLGGERTEWLSGDPQTGSSNFYLNADEWYGWSSYLPTDFPLNTTHSSVLTQFHSVDSAQACIQMIPLSGQGGWGLGSVVAPRLGFGINGGNNPGAGQSANLNSGGQTSIVFDLGAMPTGRWFDIVLHCIFKDTLTGTLEIWLDGTRLVNRSDVATLYTTSDHGYIKQGIYRSTGTTTGLADGYVWHDQFKRGDSYVAVAP